MLFARKVNTVRAATARWPPCRHRQPIRRSERPGANRLQTCCSHIQHNICSHIQHGTAPPCLADELHRSADSRGPTASWFCLVDIYPHYRALNHQGPSLSGRRSAPLKRSTCHFHHLTSSLARRPYLFRHRSTSMWCPRSDTSSFRTHTFILIFACKLLSTYVARWCSG